MNKLKMWNTVVVVCTYQYKEDDFFQFWFLTIIQTAEIPGGGNVMCVCLYQKSVCQFKVPKVCTVGLYST